jgi:hypothetical protein
MPITPLPPAPGQGPVFIMGAMGSGTTLLRLVLDSHPHIAIPQETGFMRAYNAHQFIPFKWSGRNWATRLGWDRKELDEQLRLFYDTLFMRYAQEHGKQRWGEKTPLHVWHISKMARLFPDAVFVGIVRHPGGSVASNMRRWGYSLGKAAVHHDRYNREIARQAARYPKRFVLLRYEELLLQPEPVMRELLEWLGEPWSDQVLAHHSVQAGRGGKATVEGRNKVDDPIDVSRIDKWARTMEAEHKVTLAQRLGDLADLFGYAIDDPAVLQPLNDRGALLTSGAEWDARLDRFAHMELRVQGPVPRYEQLYHPRDFTLERVPEPAEEFPGADGRVGILRRAARVLPPGARRRLRSALLGDR